jgi:Ferritin-like domain
VVSEERERPSRRGLFGATGVALAAAASVALEACGSSSASDDGSRTATTHARRPPPSPHDVRLLASALELERRTVDAYLACIPLLDHHIAKAAAVWLSEEVQHTGKLIALIRGVGGTAPPRANSYDIGPRPHGKAQTLRRLASFEQLQLSFYLKTLPEFEQGATRAAVASIFANDAQHLSLLRLVAGQTPVPSAFVS